MHVIELGFVPSTHTFEDVEFFDAGLFSGPTDAAGVGADEEASHPSPAAADVESPLKRVKVFRLPTFLFYGNVEAVKDQILKGFRAKSAGNDIEPAATTAAATAAAAAAAVAATEDGDNDEIEEVRPYVYHKDRDDGKNANSLIQNKGEYE